jgi:hypothetical protein
VSGGTNLKNVLVTSPEAYELHVHLDALPGLFALAEVELARPALADGLERRQPEIAHHMLDGRLRHAHAMAPPPSCTGNINGSRTGRTRADNGTMRCLEGAPYGPPLPSIIKRSTSAMGKSVAACPSISTG